MLSQKSTRIAAVLVLASLSPFVQAEQLPSISFRATIAPILNDHCLSCHSSKRAEGGYRVDTIEQFLTPGDSSEQPVAPDAENLGEVYARIVATDADVRMPAEHPPLTTEQTEHFKTWVTQGATLDYEDKTAPLWSIIPPATYKNPPEKYPQSIPVSSLLFTADGNGLLTSGYHEAIQWDLADNRIARRFPNQPQRSTSLLWLDDGKRFLAGGGRSGKLGELRISGFESAEIERVLARSAEIIHSVTPRPNSTEMAVAGGDSSVKLVDVSTGEVTRTFFSHADWVTQVAFNADGSKMASSSLDKSCKVYDLNSGEVVSNYSRHNNPVRGVVGIGDGTEWLSIGGDSQLHKFKADGATTVIAVRLPGDPTKFLTYNESAIVLLANKKVCFVTLSDNKVAKEIALSSEPLSIAVHEPSQRIAIGQLDGTVSLWNLTSGEKLTEFVAVPK